MFVLVYSVCSVIYLICMFHNKKESKYPNIICFLFLFFYVEMSCLLFSGCPHFRSLANAIWLFAPCDYAWDCCRVSISLLSLSLSLWLLLFLSSLKCLLLCAFISLQNCLYFQHREGVLVLLHQHFRVIIPDSLKFVLSKISDRPEIC